MAGRTRGAGARRRRSARRAQSRVVQRGVNEALTQGVGEFTPAEVEELSLIAAASGKAGLPLGPRDAKWDASAADKAVRDWAGATDAPNAKYAQAFFYKDGDGSKFGDFKLGFAEPEGGTLTANWGGVTAVAGVLSGARGGVKGISPADTATIKGKVAAYYAAARTKYKDDSIKVPWEAKDGESATSLLALAQFDDPVLVSVATAAWEDEFAMGDCANCDHSYSMHAGPDGACTMEGCACTGYEAASSAALDGTLTVRIMPDMTGFKKTVDAAVHEALLARAKKVDVAIADALLDGIPAEHADTIRMRLARFALVPAPFDVTAAPASRVPVVEPSSEPAPPATSPEVEWTAILCPEGQLTSDGRAFAPGSITWRDLPLTLMAMIETSEGGHVGAEVAGRIDRIWRDDAAGLIRAQGVFAETEYGALIACAVLDIPPEQFGLSASLVTTEVLRGVSVDLAIHNYDVGPRSDWFDEEGNWAPKEAADRAEPSILDMLMGTDEPTIAVVTDAEIGMTTVCPFPAFAVARIAVGDSLVAGANPAFWTATSQGGFTAVLRTPRGIMLAPAGRDDGTTADCGCDGALTASAEGLAPVAPPAAWFDDPQLGGPTALTVDDGRVYGHAALWGVCHIGLPGCRTAPHSTTDYAYFHLGEVECEDGELVSCGQITIDAPHAGLNLDGQAATAHYDNTGCVAAHVRVGEDEHGIWVAGAVEPTASAEKVRLLRGAKLSGDWRKFDATGHELVALLAVNVPGFPVPRTRASIVASADGVQEVVALVAAGIPLGQQDLTAEDREKFAVLAAQAEFERLARAV